MISIDELNEFDFEEANIKWLHYISSNRNSSFFQNEKKEFEKYNVIGGKIANDATATTLNQYVSYGFGVPGSEEADTFAIKKLLPNRLKDQYCFKGEKSLRCLKFIKSIRVNI